MNAKPAQQGVEAQESASVNEEAGSNHAESAEDAHSQARILTTRRRRLLLGGLIIFLLAFGVRFLCWHDARSEAVKVQSGVTEGYKHMARLMVQGGISSFFNPHSPLSDANLLGHPPGYPVVLWLLFNAFGESDTAIQFFQILCDALAAVLIFLIAAELLPVAAGLIAGLMAALAPQFAWNSVLLLPDTLAVLPILLAAYCIVRAYKRPRLWLMLAAGALVGVSCWLRANAMLLAPFLLLIIPILFERGKRLRPAAALVGGTLLVIAPLTIRNAYVFGYFIPVSLGAGQTLIEGIADYDTEGKFGLPNTDLGVMRLEAQEQNRPDYYGTLFNPDGVKRERLRLSRGFKVIRSNPIWFSGVMAQRAASMLRLERARLVSSAPPVSHTLPVTNTMPPVWSHTPAELMAAGNALSANARASLAVDEQSLNLTGDDSKYDAQFILAPVAVEARTDYAFRIPVKLKQGRMILSVKSVDRNEVYASTIIETMEGKTQDEQPLTTIQMPFVSRHKDSVQVVFANGASTPVQPVMEINRVELYALGASSNLWTRYPRALVHAVQRLFLTAVMLPLVIIGIVLLVRAKQYRTLAILLIIPAYYFCVQSALHTEYRYVLAIHCFLFVLAAFTLHWIGSALWHRLRGR